MADLRFTKNNDTQEYVAEVVVNADFNIHLERVSNGGLKSIRRMVNMRKLLTVGLPLREALIW